MKSGKYKLAAEIFLFLLWYAFLCASALGEKYFSFISCMVINKVGAHHPSLAAFLLGFVLAAYTASFLSPKLHRMGLFVVFS